MIFAQRMKNAESKNIFKVTDFGRFSGIFVMFEEYEFLSL